MFRAGVLGCGAEHPSAPDRRGAAGLGEFRVCRVSGGDEPSGASSTATRNYECRFAECGRCAAEHSGHDPADDHPASRGIGETRDTAGAAESAETERRRIGAARFGSAAS